MNCPDAAPTQRIVRLIGVYDADSTMGGELAYWVGDRFPAVQLVDHEGRPWLTAGMRGRPLVLILHRHLA